MNSEESTQKNLEENPAQMLQDVFNQLKQFDTSFENKSYSYTTENSFPKTWLIQSGPNDKTSQFLDTIQDQFKTLVQDQPNQPHFIDLSQMGNDNINDDFQGAMIDSIIAIAEKATRPVIIRYIEGNPETNPASKDMTFIQHLQNAYGNRPKANVYFYAISFVVPWTDVNIKGLQGSWTHAKMVAIDGQTAMAGGMNFWTDYIPSNAPNHHIPHDVSIHLNGKAATASHQFANTIWDYAADHIQSDPLVFKSWQLGTPNFEEKLPPTFDPNKFVIPPQPEAIPVLAVGNLGLWLKGSQQALLREAMAGINDPSKQVQPQNTYSIVEKAFNVLLDFPFSTFDMPSSKATNASTTARHLLLQKVASNGHIRISQQKIADTDLVGKDIPSTDRGGVPWPGPLMSAIVDAMIQKNVTVDIIVSNHVEGYSPVGGYSDDMGAKALYGVIVELLARALGGSTNKAQNIAKKLLTIKSTTTPISNHAKIWIVDDQVFYVGSDNVYPAYLQEFGYVIGSVEKTNGFIQDYWNPMWQLTTEVD